MGKMLKIMDMVYTGPEIPEPPKTWAAFDGIGNTETSGSMATLKTPLHLSADGDYIDFDAIFTPYADQPLRTFLDDDSWAEWYGDCYTHAVIGSRSPRSCVSWLTQGITKLRLDDSADLAATGSPRDGGRRHMRLELTSSKVMLYCDSVKVAEFDRPAGKGFTVSYIGGGALMADNGWLHTAFRMRDLTIRAGGTLHDFGNVVDSPLLTCYKVTRVTE